MEAFHKRLLWKLFSWKLFVKAYKLVMVQILNSIACYDSSTCNYNDILKVTKGFKANKNT
jgi:hypothetical protein